VTLPGVTAEAPVSPPLIERALLTGGILLVVLGLAFAAFRLGPIDEVGDLRVGAPWVLSDFRHAVYFPARAFWDGINPYNSAAYMQRYPVNMAASLYAPASFLVFAPLGLLPLGLASIVYLGLTVVLTLVLPWAACRVIGWRPGLPTILVLGGLLLLSRPGHWNLLSGQVALITVLGTYCALAFARHRPRTAGLGLAVALLKPSFGLPLLVALLVRGAGRAVGWGVAIAAALNIPVLIVLARREGGIVPLITTITESYRMFAAHPENDPVQSVWRVDLASTLSRLTGQPLDGIAGLLLGAAVLAPVALASRWRGSESSRRDAALNSLVCCAVLLSLYHQAYDLLLLALPAAVLVSGLRMGKRVQGTDVAQGVLLGMIGLNFVATQSVLAALRLGPMARLVVLSLNGIAVIGLFAIYFAQAQSWRPRQV
jgi:hypothetical protein